MSNPKNIADLSGDNAQDLGSGLVGGFESQAESWAKDRQRLIELRYELELLRAVNHEMLEALRDVVAKWPNFQPWTKQRAAIAKAEGR